MQVFELMKNSSQEMQLNSGAYFKRNETWRFEALGNGSNEGLEFL